MDISEEFDWYSLLAGDDKGKNSEGESGRPNDGQIAGGTGEQKPTTFDTSKKRRGTPIDDKEKKERKRIADQKYRGKAKGYVKYLENELQAAKSEVERFKCANELLNEEKNSNAQNVQDAATEKGMLQYENKILKDNVRKMEEELRGLKTRCYELESMNASLMAERETMTNNLHIATAINTDELQLEIYSLNEQQQQLVNMFSNGQNQELPMEQGQLGQEANGRLGFEGDEGPILGTSVSEIQSMHSEMSQQVENWKREAEEARNDCVEAKKQMLEFLKEMRAR